MLMDKLSSLLAYVKENSRICPRPMDWQDFYVAIGGSRFDRSSGAIEWNVQPPLVLSQWRLASNEAKCARLAEHIQWAAAQGRLDIADVFLRDLPLQAWHHSDRSLPNY